jgi:membrane-bound serine protease (ClpP class)
MLRSGWFVRGVLFLLSLLLYLWCWSHLFAAENPYSATLITLKGYLGKDQLAKTFDILNQETSTPSKTLVIEINSTSGEILPVLDVAKKIYELKIEKKIPVVVYIDDQAIGPAAIIPFLAEKLYISLIVSWGDVPLGNEHVISTNILRNRVTSLIDPQNPHAELLRLMAIAMTDSSVKIVDDKGWRIARDAKDEGLPVISPAGETLVVNHNQLKELGLVQGVLQPENFHREYTFSPQQQTQLKEAFPSLEGMPVPPKLFEEELKQHILFSPNKPNIIGHIIIEDRTSGINEATWLYVKSALDYYKKIKPIFVILELNTPGGEVFAAQKISNALKDLDTQFNIPVIAFINNWAISAGAMLAYSCRFIVVAKDASMGAAEPVIQGTTGKLETASEKVNSALRADFANRARFFDRDPNIAEAMVDKDVILVLRHDKVLRLDSESQIRTTGPEPDTIISPKGKLLTLDAEQLIRYGVADALLPPVKTELITEKEQEEGKWPASKMLLFQQPFFKDIPNAMVDSYRMDWKTRFFAFLSSPLISSLLFLGLLLGFYVELSSPGFGIAGTVALTCLFLIILSSFALEIANWLELILLLVGIVIILVELFVLPTFGLLGFIGIIFFLVGLFGMMLPGIGSVSFEFDTQTLNAAGQAFFERLAWLCGTLVVGFIIMILLGRYVTPSLAGFSRFVLSGREQDASQGYISGDNPQDLPQPGSKGEAISTLRPAGKIMIHDVIYDAITAGSFIEKGKPIVVVKLDGSVIVVEEESEDKT